MSLLDGALSPLAPYTALLKLGGIALAAISIFWSGHHYGGLAAEKDAAEYRATVAEDSRKATLAAWDRAEVTRKDLAAQAQALAATLAEQAKENGALEAQLTEARRRGTLIRTNPATSCPVFSDNFVGLWNAAAALRPAPGPAPAD